MSQSMPPNYDERNREESISARVYREIKNKILQLDYLPGSYLTEARLAEEYGVSRMPVRIAIQKLSSEGWLLSDFRRKLRVKDVTQKSVQDLFSFREIIETRALQKIFEDDRTWEYSFLIEQKLLRMRAARDNYYEYMVADAEMHFELITVFDNDRIKDIYYPICDELVRIDLLLSEVVTRDIHIGIEKLVAAIRYMSSGSSLSSSGSSSSRLSETVLSLRSMTFVRVVMMPSTVRPARSICCLARRSSAWYLGSSAFTACSTRSTSSVRRCRLNVW